jgi:hypothetical protein
MRHIKYTQATYQMQFFEFACDMSQKTPKMFVNCRFYNLKTTRKLLIETYQIHKQPVLRHIACTTRQLCDISHAVLRLIKYAVRHITCKSETYHMQK